MTDAGVEATWISLPPSVERKPGLGPFGSAREALKFIAIATVGAVVAGFTFPELWLPFLGGGLALTVVRSEGKGLDDRLGDLLRYQLRARTGMGTPPNPRAVGKGGVAYLGTGRRATVVRAGGIPISFLPAKDLRRTFEAYRTLLRSLRVGAYVCAGLEPIEGRLFRPPPSPPRSTEEAAARVGYDEMVRLLCRRRHRRVVFVVLADEGPGPEGVDRLESATRALLAGLEGIGTQPSRLAGPELEVSLRRLGWRVGGVGE